MRGLDTNILVRYLVRDDPILTPKAARLIEHGLTLEDPGYVSLITIIGTAWTLKTVYELSRDAVIDAIELILRIDVLFVQNAQEVFNATVNTRERRATFEDALIAALGQWAGCTSTLTFDKRASRLTEFQLL